MRLDVRIKMQTIRNLFSCHVLAGLVMLGAANFVGLVIMHLLVKGSNVCGQNES